MTVRDRLWLFASRAHDDDIWLGKGRANRFSCWSRITPAEGAAMLDIPNVVMIVSDGIPVPYSADAYGYMESFCRMKNVVWSITGSSGFRAGNEEKFICHLAEKYPNVTGAFADDFLGGGSIPEEKRKLVSDIRRTLDTACRPLSMWLTVYGRDLETCDTSVYGLFDVLTLWSWHYEELNRLLTDRGTAPVPDGCRLIDLLRRPQVGYDDLTPFDPAPPGLPPAVREQVEITVKYEGYIRRQEKQVEEFEKLERRRLPPDMDYSHIQGLRLEAREKLAALRPENLGQAGRISGVSPADIAALMVYLHTRETPPEGGTST